VTRIADSGISTDVPDGWKGRVQTRVLAARKGRERTFAVLHAATIPLPEDTSDFGSNVVRKLGAHDVFFALFEYAPESADEPIFAHPRPASLRARDFTNDQLQRQLDHQVGTQRFFTDSGRAFCVYVVLGSVGARRTALPTVNHLLDSLTIGSLDGSTPVSALQLVRSRSELTGFTAAFESAGLLALLDEPGPLTVFAPTDSTFVAPSDPDERAAWLLQFVARADLRVEKFPTRARTAAGTDIDLALDQGVPVVDGSPVIVPDLAATNGVVHIIRMVTP